MGYGKRAKYWFHGERDLVSVAVRRQTKKNQYFTRNFKNQPCTNSVAVSNLLRLSSLLGSIDLRKRAENCLAGAAHHFDKYPFILPRMLISLHAFAHSPYQVNKINFSFFFMMCFFLQFQIIVVGQSSDPTTNKMLQAIHSKFIPMATCIFIDKDKQGNLINFIPLFFTMLKYW